MRCFRAQIYLTLNWLSLRRQSFRHNAGFPIEAHTPGHAFGGKNTGEFFVRQDVSRSRTCFRKSSTSTLNIVIGWDNFHTSYEAPAPFSLQVGFAGGAAGQKSKYLCTQNTPAVNSADVSSAWEVGLGKDHGLCKTALQKRVNGGVRLPLVYLQHVSVIVDPPESAPAPAPVPPRISAPVKPKPLPMNLSSSVAGLAVFRSLDDM